MKVKFNLHATIEVPGEGREETAYTYVTEDGQRGVQWRWHSRIAFLPIVLNRHLMFDAEIKRLLEAHVEAGVKQHETEGGFDAAIKQLEIEGGPA